VASEFMAQQNSPKETEEYVKQVAVMSENARRWRAANPDKKAVIQFNFPPKALIIGSISLAVARHFVITNEAGLELLKALWPWDVENEPTVLMVRVALEYEHPN
jgi:hypothetical protein